MMGGAREPAEGALECMVQIVGGRGWSGFQFHRSIGEADSRMF